MLPVYETRKTDLTVFRNDYELKRAEHMHKYIELVYVRKGCQHIKIEKNDYCLDEGTAAVIFPNTIHSYYSLDEIEKHNADITIIMAAPKLFGNLFPNLNNLSPDCPYISSEQIHEELRVALNTISPTQKFETKLSWVCVIMSYVLDITTLKSHRSDPVDDLTYKITRYIEENFVYDISRASLAREFNVNEGYISKIFAERFKMNLRSYLGLLRAEYAANLIRTTGKTFMEISQFAGFGSLRTFNRMFYMAYGMTPRDYKINIDKLISQSTKK